jgi:hypothetical protein
VDYCFSGEGWITVSGVRVDCCVRGEGEGWITVSGERVGGCKEFPQVSQLPVHRLFL